MLTVDARGTVSLSAMPFALTSPTHAAETHWKHKKHRASVAATLVGSNPKIRISPSFVGNERLTIRRERENRKFRTS